VSSNPNLRSVLTQTDTHTLSLQFAMDPISTEDAVLCLEYLDHDFYVYKNSENNKISVVYKRNSGGVGLIEPE
jgi:hypothetical protein